MVNLSDIYKENHLQFETPMMHQDFTFRQEREIKQVREPSEASYCSTADFEIQRTEGALPFFKKGIQEYETIEK
jgi:hypothetical protein